MEVVVMTPAERADVLRRAANLIKMGWCRDGCRRIKGRWHYSLNAALERVDQDGECNVYLWQRLPDARDKNFNDFNRTAQSKHAVLRVLRETAEELEDNQ
jgi:hypothetical protein